MTAFRTMMTLSLFASAVLLTGCKSQPPRSPRILSSAPPPTAMQAPPIGSRTPIEVPTGAVATPVPAVAGPAYAVPAQSAPTAVVTPQPVPGVAVAPQQAVPGVPVAPGQPQPTLPPQPTVQGAPQGQAMPPAQQPLQRTPVPNLQESGKQPTSDDDKLLHLDELEEEFKRKMDDKDGA